MIEDNENSVNQDINANNNDPSTIFIPPPVPDNQEINTADTETRNSKKRTRLLFFIITLIAFVGIVAFGGKYISSWQEEKQAMNLSLEDTIIGSWVLYMDNSGVGAYVNLNADGSLQLTEGRLGEWTTTKHRLVNENRSEFVEFYDEDLYKWVRFMEIKKVGVNELHLKYLQ
jgi:hypothetical protein